LDGRLDILGRNDMVLSEKRLKKDKRIWITVMTGLFLWALVFWYANQWSPHTYYYDAADYIYSARCLWSEGFSLRNLPKTIRGCLFLILIGFLETVSQMVFQNHHTMWEMFASALCVGLNVYIIPLICLPADKLGTKRWAIGSCISCMLYLFYWADSVLQILSDLPALTCYAGMILCIKGSLKSKRGRAFLLGVLAGALAYAAYNTRTIYLISIVTVVAVMLLFFRESRKSWVFWLGFLLGAGAAAIPQVLVNAYWYGEWSPILQTPFEGSSNLFVFQLKNGIAVPRYETYIGEQQSYSGAGIFYYDLLGQVLAREMEILSIKDYIFWLATHLLEACGLYCKHLFSGITLFYRDGYIKNLELKAHVFLLNCSVWIMALMGIRSYFVSSRQGIARMQANKNLPFIVMILLPVLSILPGAVETRFFLPAFSLVYVYVTMGIDYAELWAYFKEHWMEMIVLALAVFLVWCMAATDFMGTMQHLVLDWSGNIWAK